MAGCPFTLFTNTCENKIHYYKNNVFKIVTKREIEIKIKLLIKLY